MGHPGFPVLLLLLACQPAADKAPPDGPADTSADSSGDTSADSSGDTSADSSGDTSNDTAAAVGAVDLTSRLSEVVGSVFYAEWQQTVTAGVYLEYDVGDGLWQRSPTTAWLAGPARQIVLGAPYGSTVTWHLVMSGPTLQWTSPDQTVTVGPIPDGLPLPSRVEGDPALWDAATPYVFLGMNEEGGDFYDDWWVMILDRQGRPVWALPTPPGFVSMHPRTSADGTAFLIDHNSFWSVFDDGEASEVARVTIDGTVQSITPTPGLHHPFTELPDGTLAWGVMEREDETLMILPPEGEAYALWSCGPLLESLGLRRQCGSNTLYYDPVDDHFLYSLYSVDTVFEIDHATGATVRSFGRVPGSYTFDPPASQVWWQHGPNLLENGDLLISTHLTEEGEEATVVREFAIDAATSTLHEVWNAGTSEKLWMYGENMGEAWRLPGGDTLHNYGSTAALREFSPEGVVVWEADWSRYRTIGRSTPLADLYAFAVPEG